MTSQEGNRNTELAGKPKRNNIKIAVAVVIFIAAVFGAKSLLMQQSAQKQQGVPPQQEAPSVVLNTVTETDLAVEREYIGKVEAVQNVSLKPQVAGEIIKVHFKEGSVVRAGQLLFSIDSSQYQATVSLRKAEVEKAEANLDRAAKYFERLKAADKRSVSKSDLDIAESDVLQGKAAVSEAKASLRLAQIDLSHTRITAPITGQIGAALFTNGNYVSPSTGALATIVQTDPIRVSFAMPDRDYLNQIEKFKKNGKSVYKTTLKLTNGKILPVSGERDFEDNEIDQQSGTMKVRLRFPNSAGFLIPGAMVRIGTEPVERKIALVIPQVAILADAQGDYAYTVDSGNIAQQKRIKLGTEVGTMREVLEGLKKDDKIIVQGVQYVRPGMAVKPIKVSVSETKSPSELAAVSQADMDAANANSSDKTVKSEKEVN